MPSQASRVMERGFSWGLRLKCGHFATREVSHRLSCGCQQEWGNSNALQTDAMCTGTQLIYSSTAVNAIYAL